jgi:hypothetical protein
MRGSRLALSGALALIVGCGVFGSDGEEAGEHAPGAGAGAEGPPGSAPPPPDGKPAPVTGAPADSELNENYGVFVAPSGAAGAPGTRQAPLSTIAEGIERAKESGKRVYVCEGSYAEQLTIEDGISVIGALDCGTATWKSGGEPSKLEGPASPVLRARDIKTATRIDGFTVTAPDGTAEEPSSIVLIAERASTLTLANSTLIAGAGLDGEAGVEGVQLVPSGGGNGEAGRAGNTNWKPSELAPSPVYHAAPKGGSMTCQGAAGHNPPAGGVGGRGGTYICTKVTLPQGGAEDLFWRTYVHRPILVGGGGAGTPYLTVPAGPGAGTDGVAGGNGASATALGRFTPAGYQTADGTAGENGQPGNGGRGGAPAPSLMRNGGFIACPVEGRIEIKASGNGGGAGGCPGLAGTPGKGGGASIAAMIFESEGLTLDATELRAGRGGHGGKGSLGSDESAGGQPGGPPTGNPPGLRGGRGGRAGVSGSGAGGPSIALAHTGGDAVRINGATLKAGEAGAGVPAQTSANGARTLPASVAGLRADVHPF